MRYFTLLKGVGVVGSGVALQTLKHGAKVWVSSRSEKRLDEFKMWIPENLRKNLGLIKGEIDTEKGADAVRDEILSKDKKINHVVSSLGGYWEKGPLSQISLDDFNAAMNEFATSHFVVFRAFAKKLADTPNSTYTFITGNIGEVGELGQPNHFLANPKISMITVGSIALYGIYNAGKPIFYIYRMVIF
jgi:NAD(P)-dependent dehydrogenase (short-subunit alcohol dehydrogenase family)